MNIDAKLIALIMQELRLMRDDVHTAVEAIRSDIALAVSSH
jgi:NACalpha-BTF3-like transcription factor